MDEKMSQYFKSARAQGISDDQIILNLQEKGWKDEDIKRGLAASTPQLTQNSQTKYRTLRIVIATAFTLILFALIGYIGFQIFVDKTIETMSKNDIVAGGVIKIDPVTEDQNIVTYTHPSGKFTFTHPVGLTIKDGSENIGTNSDKGNKVTTGGSPWNYVTIDYDALYKDTHYLTVVNNTLFISVYTDPDTEEVIEYYGKLAQECPMENFVKCVYGQMESVQKKNPETPLNFEMIQINDINVLKNIWTLHGIPETYERGNYVFVTNDQKSIVFIELKTFETEAKISEETLSIADQIVKSIEVKF